MIKLNTIKIRIDNWNHIIKNTFTDDHDNTNFACINERSFYINPENQLNIRFHQEDSFMGDYFSATINGFVWIYDNIIITNEQNQNRISFYHLNVPVGHIHFEIEKPQTTKTECD